MLGRGKTLVLDAAPPHGIAPEKTVQALVSETQRAQPADRGLDRTNAQDGTTARTIPAGGSMGNFLLRPTAEYDNSSLLP